MGRSTPKIGGVFLGTVLFTLTVCGQSSAPMIVGITVDQMRAEYLYRFNSHFKHGFRRLIDEGAVFRNTHYSHVPTYTAPGHATIYTGAEPSQHGIIGNDWYDPLAKRNVYCVSDDSVQPVGTDSDAGRMSPKNLMTTTFTDELELHSNRKSYVGSLSIKDRGAILPAGHRPDDVYWFSPEDGFITSSYYTHQLPNWVQHFNAEHEDLGEYVGVWDYLIDSSNYASCLPNNNPFESDVAKRGNTGFPMDISSWIENKGSGMILTTPWGNTLITDFALEMLSHIPEEQLNDSYADVLAVSYSSTDYIGHAYGPRSREVMDTYLRLDIEIGRMLDALDEKFGKGNYLVFLTADHGVAENPNHLREDYGMSVQNHSSADIYADLKTTAFSTLGFDAIVKVSNDQVFLDLNKIREQNSTLEQVISTLKKTWSNLDYIKTVYSRDDILTGTSVESELRRAGLSTQSGHLFLQLKDGHITYSSKGSTHGSGYTYDTHVPMILMGNGIQHMEIYRKTRVIDLAPTLSFLVGIPLPHSAFSNPLIEVL